MSNSVPSQTSLEVTTAHPSQYEVSYTAAGRGKHKLHVQINEVDISDSPFTITAYSHPSELNCPIKILTGLKGPYGITYTNKEHIIITEWGGHRVSIFDIRGEMIRTFGSHGESPDQMIYPTGIATDNADSIYVSSQHKLQKFTSTGELIKCIGQKGKNEGEFDNPRGVTLHDNQVYVCDYGNNRIQVFDTNLNFVRTISSHGKDRGDINTPHDVQFDTAGNMYVAEWSNGRVQVMDTCGQFIQTFGQTGNQKLCAASCLHIAGEYVYVTDMKEDRIVIYYKTSGKFVNSFVGGTQEEGGLSAPCGITTCAYGCIYVCDCINNRVLVF